MDSYKEIAKMLQIKKKVLSFVLIFISFFCVFGVICASTVGAAPASGINHTINFQGKVVNKADGTNLANSTYLFVFKLYDDPTAGNQLPVGTPWSETQSLSVTDGIFRATLGSVTVLPTALDFNSDSLYLSITFNGELFSSRVRLTAVPYAFNAEKVGGLTVTNTTGTLTIPNVTTVTFSGANNLTFTTSALTSVTLPQGTITLADTASVQTLTSKTIGSTGLAFSGATTDITTGSGEHFTILPGTGGNVGISTTAPTQKLDVSGSATVSGNITMGGQMQVGRFGYDPATLGNGTMAYNTATNKFRCYQNNAWTDCIGAGGTPTWNSITAPLGDLSLAMNTWKTTLTYGAATSTNNLFSLTDTNANTGTGYLMNLTTGTGSTLKPLHVAASGVESLFVNASGNVGIGTTTPVSKLMVVGNADSQQLIVRGNGTQTANLQEWQDTTPTVLASINNNGGFYNLSFYNAPPVGKTAINSTLDVSSGAGSSALNHVAANINLITEGTGGFTSYQKVFNGYLNHTGTGTLATGYGLLFAGGSTGNGNITNLVDIRAETFGSGTGVIANLTGFNTGTLDQYNTPTNIYAIDINPLTVTAGTSKYGIRIGNISGATTNYALYTNTGKIHLGDTLDVTGNVGIGTTAPLESLDVRGNASVSGNLVLAGGSRSIQTTSMNTLTIGGNTTGNISIQAGNSGAGRVQIGAGGAGTTTPDILVLDLKSDAEGSFAGTNGAMYYNASTNKFRCYENGAWKDCIAATSGGPTMVTKSANQAAAQSSTAMQNDSALSFSMTANKAYIVEGFIPVDDSNVTADLKYTFTAPSGATMSLWAMTYSTATANIFCNIVASAQVCSTTVNSAVNFIQVHGYVSNGGTAGNFQFQFAQNTSTAASFPVIKKGATLTYTPAAGADLAETYYSNDMTLSPGDVVSIDPTIEAGVAKSSRPYDKNTMGVISTNPGLLLGELQSTPQGMPVSVALSGRVPVKVSTESGAIKAGDFLTSSSLPGIAMRATKAGTIIGQALSGFDGEGIGAVVMFIKNTITNGDIATQMDGLDTLSGKTILQKLTLDSSSLMNASSAAGLSEIFADRIVTDGEIISPTLTTNELTAGLIIADRIQAKQIDGLDELKNSIAQLDAKIASLGAHGEESTHSALIGSLNQFDPNFISSSSGLTLLGTTNAYRLSIIDKLTLGLLTIDSDTASSGSIQTALVPLKLQKDSLGNLEIMGSKVVIDTFGNMLIRETLTATDIQTHKLSILDEKDATSGAVLSSSAGRSEIPAGETVTQIKTSILTEKSLIFTTPENIPTGVAAKRIDNSTIEISIANPLSQILKVNWWIIN